MDPRVRGDDDGEQRQETLNWVTTRRYLPGAGLSAKEYTSSIWRRRPVMVRCTSVNIH